MRVAVHPAGDDRPRRRHRGLAPREVLADVPGLRAAEVRRQALLEQLPGRRDVGEEALRDHRRGVGGRGLLEHRVAAERRDALASALVVEQAQRRRLRPSSPLPPRQKVGAGAVGRLCRGRRDRQCRDDRDRGAGAADDDVSAWRGGDEDTAGRDVTAVVLPLHRLAHARWPRLDAGLDVRPTTNASGVWTPAWRSDDVHRRPERDEPVEAQDVDVAQPDAAVRRASRDQPGGVGSVEADDAAARPVGQMRRVGRGAERARAVDASAAYAELLADPEAPGGRRRRRGADPDARTEDDPSAATQGQALRTAVDLDRGRDAVKAARARRA